MSGPLITAKFDDTNTHLASAMVALDSHQIKVVSVNSSQSNVNTSFNLDKGDKVSVLAWVPVDGEENQLLALGLTNGSVILYSPLTNTIITKLTSPFNALITDFHYSDITKTSWGCDINGTIYEWDMLNYSKKSQFSINDLLETAESISNIKIIHYNNEPHILIGSHSVHVINIKTHQIVMSFPAHIQPINSIVPLKDNDLFITSAKGDRFINLYSLSTNTIKSVFVAESPVLDIHVMNNASDKSILIARTESGTLEVFNNFLFDQSLSTPTSSSKKKKKLQLANSRSHSANGSVCLKRSNDQVKSTTSSDLFVISMTCSNNSIIYSWLENVSIPVFDSLRWVDDSGDFSITSKIEIQKRRADVAAPANEINGHDITARKHYIEGNAIINEGGNLQELEDDDEDDETIAEKLDKLNTEPKQKSTKNVTPKKALGANNTLTTVLSQSLKSNDHSLLETVLSNRDQQVIQNTISRLDSSLAIELLERLAERMARQATRFDQLVYWLKWILIIHGGLLSSLPGLASKLSNLHTILAKKANTLPRLMELQGRLNMVYEKAELNREILKDEYNNVGDDDEDTDVEYIEELDDVKLLNGNANGDLDSDFMSEDEDEDEDQQVVNGDLSPIENGTNDHFDDEDEYSDMEIGVNGEVEDDE